MPDDGRIEILLLDLTDEHDKYRAEVILNDDDCEVIEEKVYTSAKGDVRMYLKYKRLE